ncbi:hypothetical protein [Mycobacterium sp. OTB74]|jgi:hypothetical protein|uniref:hypothetical protein n=1 Tax=Mycobacterium sp. OTB74 TaxID=1853452 RepID=UPI00247597EB|nr:hypothetical protein [Mycobacterium sp. OTB74]MDH6244433.1 hypothetical protein [Mycobacterium sp. OTB74]
MAPQNDTASEAAAKASETLGKGADLTREVIESQFRLGGQFADMAGNAIKDSGSAFEAGRAYVDAVWREAGNYWQAVTDLNLRYANELLKIGASAADQVLAAVDTALKGRRSAGDGTAASQD